MTMQEQFTHQESIERDERLNRWFTDFFALNDFHMTELQHVLDASWMRYVRDHAFSLAREKAFGPITHLSPLTEESIEQIRIQTTSEKKWSFLTPAMYEAGLEPIMSKDVEDEDHIHDLVRRMFFTWRINYPTSVARMKQPRDELSIPALTLDTVTYVDESPLEKPKNLEEARQLIRIATGGEVTTFTSWVLLLQAKSGSTIELLNTSKIKYSILPMSASEIQDHVQTNSNVLSVPMGLDLSTSTARKRFIDVSQPVSFYGKNHLGHEGELHLQSSDLHSGIFDPYFSGVPIHAIKALLPHINDIYLHADHFDNDIV